MKKLSYLLSLFVALAIGNQLQAQCNANFTDLADSTNLVQFNVINPQSSSTYSYRWDFGDGNGSSLRSPSHTYTNPGVYYVTHNVIDTFHQVSCSFTDSVIIAGGSQNCNASYSIVKDSSTTFGVILYNNSSNQASHQL